MKRCVMLILACVVAKSMWCVVSLDSCRAMALAGNKQLKIAEAEVMRARYERRVARAAYFPSLDAEATYMHNQKQISLIEKDAYLPVMNFDASSGSYAYDLVKVDGKPITVNGAPVPAQVALLPKKALTFDVRNIFAGGVTLTQPLFAGGKIVASNKMAGLAETLAHIGHEMTEEGVIYYVDEAYWGVVSFMAKQRLAESYQSLLKSLYADVHTMLEQGVATRADVLDVQVRVNEAEVAVLKAKNDVKLAQMSLALLCSLPIDRVIEPDTTIVEASAVHISIEEAVSRNNDVKAQEILIKINEQKAVAERAAMLPQMAVVGAYTLSNPNSYNGFKNEFGGMFSIGATIKVPLWHWGGNINKYRMAQSDVVISRLNLANTRDKVTLELNKALCEMDEAVKLCEAARMNVASADENVRVARDGFDEGVLTANDVMRAHTAWHTAHSQLIDALIATKLCEAKLRLLGAGV